MREGREAKMHTGAPVQRDIMSEASWEVAVMAVTKECHDAMIMPEGKQGKGPYLNDVYTIFRILDPLPPLSTFWQDP